MRLAPAVLLPLFLGALLAAQAPLAQPVADSPDARFAEAYALYDAGLFGEAARAFEAFRHDFPAHAREPDALFYGGQAELAAGHDARAAQLLATFRRRYPAHPLAPRARLALGEFYYARGEDERAVEALRTALDEPQPPEEAARALLVIGQANLRLGRTDAAVADLQRIPEQYPRTDAAPRALYAIGFAELERGDHAEAAAALSRLATRYRRTPEDRQVGLALAEALLRSGQLARVVDEVDRRLAEMPSYEIEGGLPLAPAAAAERRAQHDRAHFLAGEALLRMGQLDPAEQRFAAIDASGAYGHFAHFAIGRIAFEREQWIAAAEAFDQAATPAGTGGDAHAAEALYYAGLAYRRAGRLDDATNRFEAAASRQPGGAYADVAIFEHGMLLYTTRRWDEAAPAFERLLERYPTSTHAGQAARMLGETYAAMGDFRRAEQAAERARDMGAASPELAGEVDFQRGYQAAQAGNFSQAEDILVRVYRQNPAGDRAGEALFWAAEAAFQQGQAGDRRAFDRALERFNSFIQNFPDHRQRDAARYALAWTHFKRGEYGRAAEAFERFLAAYRPDSEIVPYTADARLRLADSYFGLRRWNEAAAAYRRVEGPGSDYARFQIGQALANAGNVTDAIAAYSRLITDFPDSPLRAAARYSIGDLRFQQGDYPAAIEIFEEVIRQYPDAPVAARAQFAIGDARYNQGRLQEAAAAYRAVLERYPRSPLVPDALSAVEMTYSALGREDEVGRVVERFAERNPEATATDELRFRQAEGRFQRGDYAGAITELRTLLDRTRDRDLIPPALLYLGRAHAETGDAANAERYFRQLVDGHANSPLAAEASRRLGQLLLRQRRFEEALPLFRAATDAAETASEGAEARLGQAAALVGLGRTGEAEPLLTAVVNEAPTAALAMRARLRLADVLDATGRRDAAVGHYTNVASGDEGALGAEAAARLAATLLARNDFQGVIAATDRLRAEERFAGFPERVTEVLLARARAFRGLGQTGRAQETYDRIVRAFPDTPAAAVARRELAD
jgi:TolA-binding protein